jgi:hypothetical protein
VQDVDKKVKAESGRTKQVLRGAQAGLRRY